MSDLVNMITNIITCLILVIGGIFAWWKWGREKPQLFRANLEHQVFLADFDNDNIVIHVSLDIHNKGNVRLEMSSGWTEVRIVCPVDEKIKDVLNRENKYWDNNTEIDWPAFERLNHNGSLIGLVVDSDETEHLYSDFILPRSYKVIAIHSQVFFKEDPKTRWPCTTFINVNSLL
jgi:hypothetical protein